MFHCRHLLSESVCNFPNAVSFPFFCIASATSAPVETQTSHHLFLLDTQKDMNLSYVKVWPGTDHPKIEQQLESCCKSRLLCFLQIKLISQIQSSSTPLRFSKIFQNDAAQTCLDSFNNNTLNFRRTSKEYRDPRMFIGPATHPFLNFRYPPSFLASPSLTFYSLSPPPSIFASFSSLVIVK